MNKGNKKLTKEEIREMRRLYQQGVSCSEIGRKFHRDHTSVIYWIKKSGDYVEKRGRPSMEISLDRKIDKEEKKIAKNPNICWHCNGVKKNPRFAKTHFCCLGCWYDYYKPKKKGDYWYS